MPSSSDQPIGEDVLDVDAALGVVGQSFVPGVLAQEVLRAHAEGAIPAHALVDPLLVPFLVEPGLQKNSISICSNSRVRKMRLPG